MTTPAPLTIPENLRDKKIVLVNHCDARGGAAIVTFRLLQSLRSRGIDARMVVFTKTSHEPMIDNVGLRFVRGIRFCLERLKMLAIDGVPYSRIFQVSTGDFAINIHSHPWIKEADIVCLNWFNQGLLGLKGIRRLHQMGKKIVWTMHDMWAFTGICHHAYECDHYLDRCGSCMFVSGGGSPDDISHRMWERKKALYADVPMTFVAVSHWLEQKARHSSLLADQRVTTIHNAFPVNQFYVQPLSYVDLLVTESRPNLILFGAARLDDPIKGLDYAIDAFNEIFDNYPEIATKTEVHFFGTMRDPSKLQRLRLAYRWRGPVTDFKILRYLYACAKVVVSTSLYETLGGTLVEGQAGGAIPVTFGGDGREDVVTHLKNGYIASYRDSSDIARGILWALDAKIPRQQLHDSVVERFGPQATSQKYIELFSEILDGK